MLSRVMVVALAALLLLAAGEFWLPLCACLREF
jgi:hypothetical protein